MSAGPKLVRETSRLVIRIFMGAFVLLFLAGLGLVAALARGPVSLAFLEPYVVQMVNSQYPDVKVDFHNLELEWNGRDKNLMVAIDDLVITEHDARVAMIPDVNLVFSGEALLRGRIAPAELEFTGLRLRLTRTVEGRVEFGYENRLRPAGALPEAAEAPTEEDAAAAAAAIDGYLAILAEFSREPDPDSLTGYLRRVEAYDSAFFIEDETLGRFWRMSDVDMFVWREPGGLSGQASGTLKIGAENVNLVVLGEYDRARQRTSLSGQFSDLPLPLVAAQGELAELQGLEFSVSGHVTTHFDAEFRLESLGFAVEAGAGEVNRPELYHEPLPLDRLTARGSVASDFTSITLHQVHAETLGATVELEGRIELAEVGLGLTLDGTLKDLQVDDLARFWPYSMASNGYDWVTKNIRAGTVPSGEFTINLPPGALGSDEIPEEAVKLNFELRGTSADYYAPLPKVTDIDGHAVLTERDITITGLTGRLGELRVSSDKVIISDFDKFDQLADIDIHVTGPSRDIFTFLDLEPLGLASPYGIVPKAMTGTGDVHASFKFPLRFDLVLEKVAYEAKGEFTDASIPDVAGDIDLTGGDLKVDVKPSGVRVEGAALLNGVPADIRAESWFSGDKKGRRRYELTSLLGDAARTALGIETLYLKGNMQALALLETVPDGTASGRVQVDMTETVIAVEDLHWSKPAGTPAKMSADLRMTKDDVTTLSNIAVNAGDLVATGSATLEGDMLTRLSIPDLRYGENDLSLDLTQAKKNEMKLTLRGRQFDLVPFIKSAYHGNGAPAAEETPPVQEPRPAIDLDLHIDKALLDEGIVLDDVVAQMKMEGMLIRAGEATAKFDGEKIFQFSIEPQGSTRHASFVSDDAGSLFRGLDVYDDFREGALKVSAIIDDTRPSRPASGTITIDNVRLVNAPTLGKILTLGSLTGIVELLSGEGITFAKVEGPFAYENGIFSTKDFRAVGSIGITFTGTFSQPADKIDAFGTVIPAYTLNSILGNIPIIGTLLVGRQGEGIFGFSYKVAGGIEDPQVTVNPVSALAPGILRRMFFEPWEGDVEPPSTTRGGEAPSR